jgi:hypothetical protein
VTADYGDGTDNDCDGDIDEDSKPGWSLLSVNTADGNVYDIDTTSAAITSTSSVSTKGIGNTKATAAEPSRARAP